MIACIMSDDKERIPSSGDFDCIIIDEAHRGYTLDRELSEAELLYRDQNDFVSKYKKVIEYFDAVKSVLRQPLPCIQHRFLEMQSIPIHTAKQ